MQQPPAPAPDDLHDLPRVGGTLDGKYRIDGVLGSGGTGIVFAATHLRLAERVAIKMLLPMWRSEPSVVERFAQEGRASAMIRSEHIVRVLDVDDWNGQPYLVLEYLDGKDFDTLLAEGGALPVATSVDYVLQACEALAEAHAAGTIHRDLKPANLFLTHRADHSPCVKVLDFGISKLNARAERASGIQLQQTMPRTVLGSPYYMSPEQMRSAADVDERSDIWALGAIFYEMVSGAPPFEGASVTAVCASVFSDPAPRLSERRAGLPAGLDAAVLRCLEKPPANRYADVADLARALAPFGTEEARASAARIARILAREEAVPIVEVDDSPTLRMATYAPLPPLPRKSRKAGYVVALAVVGVVLALGWRVEARARRAHPAEVASRPTPIAADVTPAPVAASPGSPPPVAPTVDVPSASDVSTTSPRADGSAAAVASSAPPTGLRGSPEPAPPGGQRPHVNRPARSAPVAASRPAPVDRSWLRAPEPPAPVAPSPEPLREPSPTPAPSASATPDPDPLFDDRK